MPADPGTRLALGTRLGRPACVVSPAAGAATTWAAHAVHHPTAAATTGTTATGAALAAILPARGAALLIRAATVRRAGLCVGESAAEQQGDCDREKRFHVDSCEVWVESSVVVEGSEKLGTLGNDID